MPRVKLIQGSPDETEAAYYDALARADVEALMRLWADDEEIVCIHPGAARLVGHVAIRNTWEEILSRGGLQLQPRQLHATQSMTTAIHSVIEEVVRPDNVMSEIHIVATNIYLKTAQGWRMVMHHASAAPGPAPTEPIAETMLH